MIGLLPNVVSPFSALSLPTAQDRTLPTQTTDTGQCPAIPDIQSKPYTDPDLPPPYGEGYQYTATANGKAWTGQTAGTNDDYLDPEYALTAEAINEQDGKVQCDYGGKRLIKNGVVADPYLRLTTLK
ncbi:hypothetical protein SAMN04490179_1238 [Pseudomonas antarctica]|uniref:Uncharacterized protein n=1 Tax=Pseudomonas antarctica TaxID=219572 RepID=A0A1G9WKR1_9PSED|nr:hypothetical protein [Pseudomonas antarctica]KAF2409471.1 hypothetical protein PSAN_18760 [Pseudomonas antarctica]SDM85059.1 hypothetical protein SAMN04490179_1238 [Pseudomonas antarctica]